MEKKLNAKNNKARFADRHFLKEVVKTMRNWTKFAKISIFYENSVLNKIIIFMTKSEYSFILQRTKKKE